MGDPGANVHESNRHNNSANGSQQLDGDFTRQVTTFGATVHQVCAKENDLSQKSERDNDRISDNGMVRDKQQAIAHAKTILQKQRDCVSNCKPWKGIR